MMIVFLASIIAVAYTYLGYPLVLWVFATLRPREVRKGRTCPSVSVIIAARNEADKIRAKIENTLALNYPICLLEVIVASDASDDGTDEIVAEYRTRHVRLIRAPQRRGKEYAQGLAVATAKGEIVVFTDTATVLELDALYRLVLSFSDPTVGAVSTEDVLVDSSGNPTAEGLYVRYEMWVRRLENRFYSLVGLSGSCFAVRKELCTDWSPILASDFMASLRAARRGYRSIADPSARGKFPVVASAEIEIQRKIRTFARGITVLMVNWDLLNPLRYGRFAFQLASHKLLRFLAPFLLLTTLATSGLLAGEQPFRMLFLLQVGWYVLGVIAGPLKQLQRYRIVRVAYYFVMVNWAMLVAWGKYVRGHHQVTWEPSKRPAIVTPNHRQTP